MLRDLLAALLLCGLAWFVYQEQQAGRFRQVDEGFRDFLIANVRERFVPQPTEAPPQVVHLQLKESEAAEFETWPPSPLEWQLLLAAVAKWQPEVLVIAEPLNWGQPPPAFLPALAAALQAFPSVVLAVEADYSPSQVTAFLGGLDHQLPIFSHTVGNAPPQGDWLKALIVPPDESLRPQTELGLHTPTVTNGDQHQIPYALRVQSPDGSTQWRPTLLAQTMSRITRSPYILQRLRVGPGAGIHLEGGHFVPLAPQAHFEWSPQTSGAKVLQINALDLLAGDLAEVLPDAVHAQASQAQVVLIGQLSSAPSDTSSLAQALATLLALPTLKQLPLPIQWALWAMSGLLAFLIARRRRHPILRALIWIFIGFVITFLLFQSQLLWFPPTLPATLLLTAGLLGKLIGPKSMPT